MPPCYPPSKCPLAGLTQLAEQDLTQPSIVPPSQETVEVRCILIKCMVINDRALAMLTGCNGGKKKIQPRIGATHICLCN